MTLDPQMILKRSMHGLFLVMLIGVPCIAIAQPQRERSTGQSTISGRVLFGDTGRPVRRATVILYTNPNHPGVRFTAANQRGEFRFNQVAAGSYFVVGYTAGVTFPQSAIVLTEFGLAGGNLDTQVRVTVDGKNTTRCEVRVVRGGTIKGTMTYADKEPVVNARVMIYRSVGKAIVPFFPKETRTNDRGMYRIDGLPEGEYFVGAAVGKSLESNSPRDAKGIPSAYYPGVGSLAEAKTVVVQAGAEAAGIDITFGDEERRTISGVVKWRGKGTAVERASVSVRRKDEPQVEISLKNMFRAITPPNQDNDIFMMRDIGLMTLAFPQNTEATEQGEWIFEDLPPATYVVSAFARLARSNNKPAAERDLDAVGSLNDRFVSREVEVTLDREDRHITIELSEGARILGTIATADGSPPPGISILVNQHSELDFLLNVPVYSEPDGTFVIEAVPAGDVLLDVDTGRNEDLYVTSITLGGHDLLREPLRMKEGSEVTGVRVTLGKGLAKLSGRVQLKEDATPAGGAGVFLIPVDPKLWYSRARRIFAVADVNGLFELKCAPGEYLVFTWPAGGQPLQPVESFVQTQAATARRISLQSKEEKQVELTISAPRK